MIIKFLHGDFIRLVIMLYSLWEIDVRKDKSRFLYMKSYWKSILFVFVSLLLSACYEDISGEMGLVNENASKVVMTFGLKTSVMEMPDISEPIISGSKAAEAEQSFSVKMNDEEFLTRAELSPITKENLLSGLWVLQFDNSNNKLVLSEYHTSSEIQNNKLSVALSDIASTTVYFVGNVASGQFSDLKINSTLRSDFESLLLTYTGEASITNANASLPMVGVYIGSASSDTKQTIELQRLAAKIVFTCKSDLPAGESFAIKTMQLCCVPKISSYKVQPVPTDASPVYPAANAGNFMDYYAVYPQGSDVSKGVTQVWYVPENLRGVKKGLTEAQKGEANAPAFSTYIEVKGTYTQGTESFDVVYRVYPGGNASDNFNLIRNYKYTITMTIKGANPGDRVVVNKTTDDLSVNGTANCYIVSKAGRQYKFKKTPVGNGVATKAFSYGSQQAMGSGGVSNRHGVKAFVVWETGEKGSVIVPGSVKVEGDYVFFSTAGTTGSIVSEGNAVIATIDDSGKITWSWHIWATRYDPNADYDIYYTSPLSPHAGTNIVTTPSRHYTVMKYNLGADVTAAEGDIGLHGLLYQWGRKDPFIGPRTYTSSGMDFAQTSNAVGYEWQTVLNSVVMPSSYWTELFYSIYHPTHFMRSNGVHTKDWATSRDTYQFQKDNLWGNPSSFPRAYPNSSFGEKTLFDPCPPGWRVPPPDLWTNFIDMSRTFITGQGALIGAANAEGVYKNGYRFYFYYGKKDRYAFYPDIIGRFYLNGELSSSGGAYWSSSTFQAGRLTGAAMSLFWPNRAYVGPLADSYRGNANAVRCIREDRW